MRGSALHIIYNPDKLTYDEAREFATYINLVGDRVLGSNSVYFHGMHGKRVLAWKHAYTKIERLQNIAIELNASFMDETHHIQEIENGTETVKNSSVFRCIKSLDKTKCIVYLEDQYWDELEALIAEDLGNVFATVKLQALLKEYYIDENVENIGQ